MRESEPRELRPLRPVRGNLKDGEGPMRFIDVVLAAVLLGLIISFFTMTGSEAGAAHGKVVSERMTWIWTPALPRRSAVQ